MKNAITKRIITSYEKASLEIKAVLYDLYSDNIDDEIKNHFNPIKGNYFKALLLEHNDTSYLIKFNKKDSTAFEKQMIETEQSNLSGLGEDSGYNEENDDT